ERVSQREVRQLPQLDLEARAGREPGAARDDRDDRCSVRTDRSTALTAGDVPRDELTRAVAGDDGRRRDERHVAEAGGVRAQPIAAVADPVQVAPLEAAQIRWTVGEQPVQAQVLAV